MFDFGGSGRLINGLYGPLADGTSLLGCGSPNATAINIKHTAISPKMLFIVTTFCSEFKLIAIVRFFFVYIEKLKYSSNELISTHNDEFMPPWIDKKILIFFWIHQKLSTLYILRCLLTLLSLDMTVYRL